MRTLDDRSNPLNIYLFQVSNRNTGKRCKLCPKLTIATPEQGNVSREVTLVISKGCHLIIMFF